MSAIVASALVATALAIAPGDAAVVEGSVATRFDGTRFDAAEVFDAEAGGLRVAARGDGSVTFVATGGPSPGCVAAAIAAPCLVPRLGALAHARLLTVEELERSLEGAFAIEVRRAPPPPPSRAPMAIAFALVGVALAFVLRALRRRAPMHDVEIAARAARLATRDDPALAALHARIEELVAEAGSVDRERRTAEASLALHREVRGPRSSEELEARAAIARRVGTLRARLSEIASALRLVATRARVPLHEGGRAPVAKEIEEELAMRDRALAEVDAG